MYKKNLKGHLSGFFICNGFYYFKVNSEVDIKSFLLKTLTI
jgi:hypothetical protein